MRTSPILRKDYLSRAAQSQQGITGLETAIILIAFTVVASIFAYTVLSAGLFASQKSRDAVYSGLSDSQSAVELKGSLVATAEPGNLGASGYVSQLTLTLANALGGDPMDFTPPNAAGSNNGRAASGSNNIVSICYIDQNQKVEDLYWTSTQLGNTASNNMLTPSTKVQITIGNPTAGAGGGNLANALSTPLGVNQKFTIQIKTPSGATLSIERTTPAVIGFVMNLN